MDGITENPTKNQKYYNNLTAEKKQSHKKKVLEYQRHRYANDEVYRKKVCDAKKVKYDESIKHDAQAMERRRIVSYIHTLNMKNWAGVDIKKTKKFEEYEICYNDFDGVYFSKRL